MQYKHCFCWIQMLYRYYFINPPYISCSFYISSRSVRSKIWKLVTKSHLSVAGPGDGYLSNWSFKLMIKEENKKLSPAASTDSISQS